MSKRPLLSYIVLSYNYERLIGQTLQSIISQTVQDFEIVVVDDHSTDGSVAVVSGITDPRIRLFMNEKNIGGAASYNRAVQEARGEWLVNLDADDWIAPNKAELQLAAVNADPGLDIIGTYVSVFDENDAPHPSADALSAIFSSPHNFNLTDTWVGSNHLCRSSTMVRASAHHAIGLDDPDMVRAPDYELWTRALSRGLRIGVVPDHLTFIRMHSRGVTHADPIGSFLEMSFAMLRNLVPLCESRALYPTFSRILTWVGQHPSLGYLLPSERYRLLGMFMEALPVERFADFKSLMSSPERLPNLAEIGRRALALVNPGAAPYQEISKLRTDVLLYVEARDYWHARSDRWEQLYTELSASTAAALPPPQEASTPPAEQPSAPQGTGDAAKRLLKRVLNRVAR
ncbi:MAG: glycosyltransferase family 2 protein [Gammaproteobacteria bacterium]|nr:glycosyltransferase family 2 protein [Gammaproteobacteria bacterium]